MKRPALLLIGALTLAACTERLVTPGGCPSLCPGGPPEILDTVLTAVAGLDSAFTGYSSPTDAISLLVSNGGALGESRALIRFIPRGDSVFAGDSLKPFTIDSVVLSVFLQARDTTVNSLELDLYRLPATFDSLTPFAEIDAAMTPAALLRTVTIANTARTGRLEVPFKGAELDKLAFPPEDSTRLVIGFRLRSPTPTGLYLGSQSAGDATPLYRTFTEVDIADTTLQHPVLQRGVSQNLTAREHPSAPHADLLRVGGDPASRALIRFEIPRRILDSATIIRATLELVPDAPVVGIAGDSARIDVRSVIADFGAKSVVNPSAVASRWISAGSDTVRIDIANLVSLWQGDADAPLAVRVQLGQEFASFLAPDFRSSRRDGEGPRLRITYRPPYGVKGL